MNEAADAALSSPQPAPETAAEFVYSPDVDPTSEEFDTEGGAEVSGNPGTVGKSGGSDPPMKRYSAAAARVKRLKAATSV